jgi:hypothetical protein
MIRSIMDTDPVLRLKRIFHQRPGEDEFVIETKADVTAVLDQAKEEYAHNDGGIAGARRDMVKVAQIPLTVWFAPVDPQDPNSPSPSQMDERELKRWLNDRDNLVFRTRQGRV